MLSSNFFRRNVRLKLPGGRHRHTPARRHQRQQHDAGSDYPHSELRFPQSRRILAGVSEDEQAKPAPDPVSGIAGGNTTRVDNFDVARLTVPV